MAHLKPVQAEPLEEPTPSSGSWFRWLLPYSSRITRALPAFGYREFRIFWIGQLVSLTGTWVQSVAQQWLVLKLTGSAFALGLVTTVQFTPLLLLALLGGAISDRVSKRDLLLATQVMSGILALILGLLVQSGHVQYWHVLVIAGLLGTVNAFYTPARQAFVPELVDKDVLLNAVALNSALFNGARVIGPALGGVLIATIGLSLNFFLNAASFVAVIAGLLLIRPRRARESSENKKLLQEVGEGLRYIAETPVVFTLLLLVGVASLFAFNFTSLLPLFARYDLHVGASGFGLLTSSMGLGSLTGAITLAFVRGRRHTRALVYSGAMICMITEIAFSFSRLFGVSVALLVVVGLSMSLFTTTANTRVLSLTPSHLQGRVMSVYSLMFLGMTPFGSLLSGIVAERWGAPVALGVGAAITLAFTLAVFAYRTSRRTEQPAAPPQP